MTPVETVTIILAVLSLLTTVALFIIGRVLSRISKRGESRREENGLILRGLLITGDLSRATGLAFKEGRCNGCMDDALNAHETYRQELAEFICKPRI